MKKEDALLYLNKRIKLQTKQGGFYSKSIVVKVTDETLQIEDKFGEYVIIDLGQISIIEIDTIKNCMSDKIGKL